MKVEDSVLCDHSDQEKINIIRGIFFPLKQQKKNPKGPRIDCLLCLCVCVF
jgi:hypothetical protein